MSRRPTRDAAAPDDPEPAVEVGEVPDDDDLIRLTAKEAMHFFLDDDVFNDGLIADSARPGSPCSVAAVGFSLAVDVAACDLGLMTRDAARDRTLRTVRRLIAIPHGDDPEAGGMRGYFYHFLDLAGTRTWECEISSIDTALLMAGLLVAAGYFDDEEGDAEREIRETATRLYEAVEWPWLLRDDKRLSHGWRPEAVNRRRKHHDRDGFITATWDGYNEGLLLQILALGSPTSPIGRENYDAWCAGYDFREVHGQRYFHCPPLFVHQFPQGFVDFRGLRDGPCRARDLDYFENSRRATLAQVAYAAENPKGFAGYGRHLWGLSASNGPGNLQKKQLQRDGKVYKFKSYAERGVPPPHGETDDGTLAPWAAAAALPYLPDESIAAIRAHRAVALRREGWSGFLGSYNLTYVSKTCPHGWYDEYDLAIEQGPIVIAAANHLKGTIWNVVRRSGPIRRGLERAGFSGGWLETEGATT